MPISPQPANDAIVTCRVLLGGNETDAAVSIEVQHALGQLPSACVVLAEGPMTDGDSDGDWPLSNGDTCLPGTSIEIQAGYGASRGTIFKGLIARLRVSADSRGPLLTLDCIDADLAPALDAGPALEATWGQDFHAFDAQFESAEPPGTVATAAMGGPGPMHKALAPVRGTARVQGSARAQVGGLLKLAGVWPARCRHASDRAGGTPHRRRRVGDRRRLRPGPDMTPPAIDAGTPTRWVRLWQSAGVRFQEALGQMPHEFGGRDLAATAGVLP